MFILKNTFVFLTTLKHDIAVCYYHLTECCFDALNPQEKLSSFLEEALATAAKKYSTNLVRSFAFTITSATLVSMRWKYY